ncbi:hypothetical protein ACFLTU_04400 [Bacteroidota bacterium]
MMADSKEVLKYLKLSVNVEQEPGQEIREHLKNTLLGTPGKLRYRHTSFDTKLPFLGRIYFLILRRSEKLLGSIAFSLREIQSPENPFDAWYIRYFSVQAPLRDSKYKRKRMKRIEKKKLKNKPHGDSLLKNFSQPYFDDPDNLLIEKGEKKNSSIVYAYVERENLRSWNFSETIGFETIGGIHSTLFSRYNPKIHPQVSAIKESEKELHLDRMREFYSGHTFYTEQNLFFGNHYLVWRENGEILAGCQANPEVWDLVDYPGGMNKILMKYGTRLPIIKRMFDPGYQKFIAVEGIWYKQGHEKCLHPLFESACAMHAYHAAVIWLDDTGPVFTVLQSLGNLGIISKLLKPAVGDIRVKFNNYTEEDKKIYFDRPAYISCFDMT